MVVRTCKIIGIVNVTPDSFSDGGTNLDPQTAFARARELLHEGADLAEIGGESTRPGAEFVSCDEEWNRIGPVLTMLQESGLCERVCVDTNTPEIMRRAATLGVRMINDVKGGADEDTLRALAAQGVTYCAMHMPMAPAHMQNSPLPAAAALQQVAVFFEKTHALLSRCGFQADKILLDPGIGFGKSDAANLQLIAQALRLAPHYNIMLGISRKSMLARLLAPGKGDVKPPAARDDTSKAMELIFMTCGIHAIRTHAVMQLVRCRDLLNSEPIGRGHG